MVDLAIPTWTLVRQAIQSGKNDEALTLLEHACGEDKTLHDILVSARDDAVTYLVHHFGEAEVPRFWRESAHERVKKWLSLTPGVEDGLQVFTEYHRGHFSEFIISEEPEKYVIRHDPCGSGGRLMRTKNVARVRQAHPWSWGKSNVPYYCTHCCMQWEIIPTELHGYPARITLAPEKPEDPCIHFHYKAPELIPAEYFPRIGFKKPSQQPYRSHYC